MAQARKSTKTSSKDVGAIIAERARTKTLSATDVKNIQRFLQTVEKTLEQFREATMLGW